MSPPVCVHSSTWAAVVPSNVLGLASEILHDDFDCVS